MKTAQKTVVGALVAAILASACCWLPLLLIGLGGTALGTSAFFEAYRPILSIATVLLLGLAFWLTYRRPSGIESASKSPGSKREDCCSPESGGSRASVQHLNRLLLWPIAIVTLAFLLFPYYVGSLVGSSSSETAVLEGASFLWIPQPDVEGTADQVNRLTTGIEELPFIAGTDVLNDGNRIRIDLAKDMGHDRKQDVLDFLERNEIKGLLLPLHQRRFLADGMTCAACAAKLEHAMLNLDSVGAVSVDHESGIVLALMTKADEGIAEAMAAVATAGYSMHPAE